MDRAEVLGRRLATQQLVLWFDPGGPGPVQRDEALLLPLYDEATLTYPQLGVPQAADHPHVAGSDLVVGRVVVDAVDVGLWRREVKGRRVEVALDLAPGAGSRVRRLATGAAERLAAFLGCTLVPAPAAGQRLE